MKLLPIAIALLAALQPASAERISQRDFKALIAEKNVTIVDVRDVGSFKEGHIPEAILLPHEDVVKPTVETEKIIARLKVSTAPVVVYCACGGESSSLHVAALLRERGVRDARALTGGWVDWFNGGNRIARGQ